MRGRGRAWQGEGCVAEGGLKPVTISTSAFTILKCKASVRHSFVIQSL